MACNTCSKSFSLLRPEKGCPGCGFSYCSKCLNHKVFLQKLNSEAKVCYKCSCTVNDKAPQKIEPPDAYYKRIGVTNDSSNSQTVSGNAVEQQIAERLNKLKENKGDTDKTTNEDIITRLQKLKGDIPSTSNAEIEMRLAKIKGVPTSVIQSKPILPVLDSRTEEEQADDLFKQYLAQANIDKKYKDEFDGLVGNIETRLQNLKGSDNSRNTEANMSKENDHFEDEDEIIKKIIEKAKVEAKLDEDEVGDSVLEELPFCEICNEDAKMRCLGCKYLFCKRCFLEHKDDDDDCNRYELYTPKGK